MDTVVFEIITIPLALLFSGIGVFAWRRKKPMWFWSGSTVSEREIADIPAYNRANGIMWLAFSAVIWASVILGFFGIGAAGIVLCVGILAGIPVLIVAYKLIYNKYKRRK